MNHAKTIYDVPSLIRTVLPTAASTSNIQARFRSTSIRPLNQDILQDHDFAPSQVTDRPDPALMASVVSQQESPVTTTAASTLLLMSFAATEASTPSKTSSAACSSAPAEPITKVSSPSTVRPFPKAGPKKTTDTGRRRRRRKSDIYMDTPVQSINRYYQNMFFKKALLTLLS